MPIVPLYRPDRYPPPPPIRELPSEEKPAYRAVLRVWRANCTLPQAVQRVKDEQVKQWLDGVYDVVAQQIEGSSI